VTAPVAARRWHADLIHWTQGTVARFSPVPQVVTIHDVNFLTARGTYDPAFAAYARLAFRDAAHRAAAVIAVSEWARRQFVERLDADPATITVVPLGVDPPHPAPVAASIGAPYVLCVSAVEPHKNLPSLVRVFGRVAVLHPGLRLVIAGPAGRGMLALAAVIDASSARDRIVHLLEPSDPVLAGLYAGATAFVFPSFAEGFGLAPVEAMSYGVPVAASRATAIPEVLGEAAVYFDPRSEEEMEAAIRSVVEDEGLRVRLAEAGRQRATGYSWGATAAATARVYRSLVGRETGSG
jgi:glycosyltransferase involved in cell wall biosynthesis